MRGNISLGKCIVWNIGLFIRKIKQTKKPTDGGFNLLVLGRIWSRVGKLNVSLLIKCFKVDFISLRLSLMLSWSKGSRAGTESWDGGWGIDRLESLALSSKHGVIFRILCLSHHCRERRVTVIYCAESTVQELLEHGNWWVRDTIAKWVMKTCCLSWCVVELKWKFQNITKAIYMHHLKKAKSPRIFHFLIGNPGGILFELC